MSPEELKVMIDASDEKSELMDKIKEQMNKWKQDIENFDPSFTFDVDVKEQFNKIAGVYNDFSAQYGAPIKEFAEGLLEKIKELVGNSFA